MATGLSVDGCLGVLISIVSAEVKNDECEEAATRRRNIS